MPSRNVVKQYVPDAYYHVYNRGISKQVIYHDQQDYAVFLNLLKRYLDTEPAKDKKGREYESFRGSVELLAFCLMPNHFHLFFYLHDQDAITRLIKAVAGAYTVYYNKKYHRTGPLFQSRYKASHVLNEAYLLHITRYIHTNPKDYMYWSYSSLGDYLGERETSWLQPGLVTSLFGNSVKKYRQFLLDHDDYRDTFELVKPELAI